MNQRKIELARERDFGEIISDSIHFVRQNFKTISKPLIYICLAFILLTIATGITYQLQMIRLYGFDRGVGMGAFDPGILSSPGGFLWSTSVYLFFYMLAYVSVTLVSLCYIKLYDVGGQQPPSKEAVWDAFKARFGKFLLISVAVSVVQIIGIMLCLLPGIYLFPILSLVLVMVVMDDMSLGDAFSRASSLIKDHWWATFGTLLVIMIIISISSYLFALPGQILLLSGVFIGDSYGLVLTGSIINIIIQSFAIFLYVLFIVASTLCYFSLREKKEGVGLMGRINAFGENTEAGARLPDEEY